MEKKYKEQELKNKLAKAQEKLKEYKKKLKFMPAILFTILYGGIFTMMLPIGGVLGIIKALFGGFTAIGTSIYFWIYREKLEPKYEKYVKFLEETIQTIEKELEDLKFVKIQETNVVSNEIVNLKLNREVQITKTQENNDDLNINSL